jgi:hypothetical protein
MNEKERSPKSSSSTYLQELSLMVVMTDEQKGHVKGTPCVVLSGRRMTKTGCPADALFPLVARGARGCAIVSLPAVRAPCDDAAAIVPGAAAAL